MQSSSSTAVGAPSSLLELCVASILKDKRFQTIRGCFELYSKVVQCHAFTDPRLEPLRFACIRRLRDYYPILLDKIGEEELAILFKDNVEDFALIRAGYEESQKAKKYFSTLKGVVLERTKAPAAPFPEPLSTFQIKTQNIASDVDSAPALSPIERKVNATSHNSSNNSSINKNNDNGITTTNSNSNDNNDSSSGGGSSSSSNTNTTTTSSKSNMSDGEYRNLVSCISSLSEDDASTAASSVILTPTQSPSRSLHMHTVTLPYMQDMPTKFYPLSALLSGVEWPAGIDTTRREMLLSDLDFALVFKMSKGEFAKLPSFKRERAKKESKLF